MSKSTLRQKVRSILRSKEDQTLIKAGVCYPSGALTKEGRKVVLDLIFQEDKELKAQVVELAVKLNEDACKDK